MQQGAFVVGRVDAFCRRLRSRRSLEDEGLGLASVGQFVASYLDVSECVVQGEDGASDGSVGVPDQTHSNHLQRRARGRIHPNRGRRAQSAASHAHVVELHCADRARRRAFLDFDDGAVSLPRRRVEEAVLEHEIREEHRSRSATHLHPQAIGVQESHLTMKTPSLSRGHVKDSFRCARGKTPSSRSAASTIALIVTERGTVIRARGRMLTDGSMRRMSPARVQLTTTCRSPSKSLTISASTDQVLLSGSSICSIWSRSKVHASTVHKQSKQSS